MRSRAGSNTALFPGRDSDETNLPAVQDAARAAPRFFGAHALARRARRDPQPALKRSAAPRCLGRPAARARQRNAPCGVPSEGSVWERRDGSGAARISSACCARVSGVASPGSRSSSNAAMPGCPASECSLLESMLPRRRCAIASSAASARRFDSSRGASARSTSWCAHHTGSGRRPT